MTQLDVGELNNKIHRLISEGQYNEALQFLFRKIDSGLDLEDSYFLAGYCLFLLKNYGESAKLLEKSLQLNPEDYLTHYYLGCAKSELREYLNALRHLNSAEPGYINEAIFYTNRGYVKRKLGLYKEAIEDFDVSVEFSSNDASIYYERAVARGLMLDFQGALVDLDKAIALNPKWALPYSLRAKARYNLKNISGCFSDCLTAFNLNVFDEDVYREVAVLYFNWKREIEKAICCVRISLLLNPDDALSEFELANYYSDWQTRGSIDNDFIKSLGKYSRICQELYIDDIAFSERLQIAIGLYSKSFSGLLDIIRTDLSDEYSSYTMYLFMGKEEYLFEPIENRCFYFSDVRCFTDKTDCSLLHEINRTKLSVRVSYENIRIRCLCKIEEENGINQCRSMWDRYANGHKGVAYKLSIQKDWLIHHRIYFNKVSYTTEEFNIKCESPEQVILDGLFKKDIGYQDENEWRMIRFGKYVDKEGIIVPFQYEDKTGVIIEQVFIGSDANALIESKMTELCSKDKIKLSKMKLDKNGTLTSRVLK